jgi:hypothetical protein
MSTFFTFVQVGAGLAAFVFFIGAAFLAIIWLSEQVL